VDGFWKVTYMYNYSGARFIFSDTSLFRIPPQGKNNVSLAFPGSGQHRQADTPLIIAYEKEYRTLLGSSSQTDEIVEPEGINFGGIIPPGAPPFGPLCPPPP